MPNYTRPQDRYRKKLATTVSPDTAWLVNTLSEPHRKGHFLDEAVLSHMTNSYYFNTDKHGGLILREQGIFFHFVDFNDEVQSPDFRSMREGVTWLLKNFPEIDYIKILPGDQKTLF